MAAEIERKFVVGDPPAGALDHPSLQIDQGYLVSDGETEVRLRRRDSTHFLTIKKGHGSVREETEVEITPEQFDRLWPQTEGWRVEKRRYLVPLDEGLTAEMDVYAAELEGLVTVEVEFGSEAAGRDFSPPGWFGDEVTGDVAYSNQQMARRGIPR